MSVSLPVFQADLLNSQLRQEYHDTQTLLQDQTGIIQRFLQAQAANIASSLVEHTAQIRFKLPDQVYLPGSKARPVPVPPERREHVLGGLLMRWSQSDIQQMLNRRLLELEQSGEPATAGAARLIRHCVAHYIIYTLLPSGRSVEYAAVEGEEIPSIPVERYADRLPADRPSALTAAGDAIAEGDPGSSISDQLLVPFVPAARRFFLPQWVAFDEQDQLLVNSEREAEGYIENMQRYLQILHVAADLKPSITVDRVYQQKRCGMLGQLVNQGRALARFQTLDIIQTIKARAKRNNLNRGLSISMPYFNDQLLQMGVLPLEIIPAGRIMFARAFVVKAVHEEITRVAQDTRLSSSARKYLLENLRLFEVAFALCPLYARLKRGFMYMVSIVLLIVIVVIAYRIAPREKETSAAVHGAGQIGLLAAIALFGVDYFTSYFYATGEMMSALHPYGLQQYAYGAVALVAFANLVFGFLYMYSLGVFNEGGGSYTASMRYLAPALSLVVAVTLIQDYVLTIVVSALSGGDQLLSIDVIRSFLLSVSPVEWFWHFLIGALLAGVTWYLTIRGRGESAQVTFMMLGIFVLMTIVMFSGLVVAHFRQVPAVASTDTYQTANLWQALMHLLTASMKGMVALTGLEAMSNGIQFVINEDSALVVWGRKKLPRLEALWQFYSGKSGIGRVVQTSFLFYGGITTLFLTFFAIRFNVFDGTLDRSLVGNLSLIGFSQIPGGEILFWVYQILAVALLAAASMTALQDAQATEWRDVAIGEIPEAIVYRDKRGTFTRSVTITFVLAVVIMLVVRGQTTHAVPYYGVGVFMPIMVMGLAVRQHVLATYTGARRFWGNLGASFAAALGALVFVGQVVGKWSEGGWVVLISFTILALAANAMLISPLGYRDPLQIHRIVRDKARVQGAMASIVEWQSLKMQEYRYSLLVGLSRFFELFGVRRPARFDPPAAAGDYDHALHVDHPEAPSLLQKYLDEEPQPPAELP